MTHPLPYGVIEAQEKRALAGFVDFPQASPETIVSLYRMRRLEQVRTWVVQNVKQDWTPQLSLNDAILMAESRASRVLGRVLHHAETRVLREAVRDISAFWHVQEDV